jgi:hypothetical protein
MAMFCDSKFFAVQMAASITRSDFILGERTRKRCPVACDSLVLDLLDFNIYAVANRAPITGAGSQ